MNKTRI